MWPPLVQVFFSKGVGAASHLFQGGQTEADSFSASVPLWRLHFLAPKSSRSFQPGLASLSSLRTGGWFPGMSLASCRVSGSPGPPCLLPSRGGPGGSPGPLLWLSMPCASGHRGADGGPICQSCALALSASLVGPCAMDPL